MLIDDFDNFPKKCTVEKMFMG